MARIQREQVDIKLPAAFDPAKHQNMLLKLIADRHGPGWEIDHIDPDAGTASASRQAVIAEITESKNDSKNIKLPKGTKPGDGEKTAAKLEDQYEGFYLTAFEPYLGWATLTKLSDDTARARGACAVALGVKPWDVQIRERPDGGFDLTLPKTFVPSKHTDKLQEVAESVVGREGWYVTADAQKLVASIIPADPPSFPNAIPYPFNARIPQFNAKAGAWAKVPIGRKLGHGAEPGEQLDVDLSAAAHGSIAGISNGGKTVAINGFIYGLLARGFELAVVDVKHKSVDFAWVKPFVRDGGWGCETIAAGVATLSMAIAEAERRAKLIAEHRVQKWTELPASLNIRPIAIVLDEVTALFLLEEVPRGLPKDHSLVVEAMQINLEKQILKKLVGRVAAEWRFAGLHIFVATQMAQNNTGVPPTIKINLGNKFLFGANPNDTARGHALSDPRSVPKVPTNIQNDSGANRGVAVAELEGQQAPCVFKAYFATTDDYEKHLISRGARRTTRPEPTASEIARFSPSLEEEEPPSRMAPEHGGFGRGDRPAPRADGLSGAAAAAHDLHVAEQQSKRSTS